jgi:hypothetical protein
MLSILFNQKRKVYKDKFIGYYMRNQHRIKMKECSDTIILDILVHFSSF